MSSQLPDIRVIRSQAYASAGTSTPPCVFFKVDPDQPTRMTASPPGAEACAVLEQMTAAAEAVMMSLGEERR